ncbi:DUF6414 family protein [Acinetobacter ursingii]|uniref:DUF6414 family protein n=1 Tax=Acinetobacter ursingii TaxID=108980 RepID=UPI0021CD4B1E|nr:hypothetical protein [Acinetobacter ursingii]MCU4481343.1 hypothetical protein [Acinetobacter ursingii]MCU4505675.1 hypothetical protein [Acinetobacter ursingii]MCU4569621.1 hypothetical protein [Acinetobacter ursingii]
MAEKLQDIESIFDFFYLDNTKIKSFYAQLTGNGALASFKNFSNITDIRKFEASVGVPSVANGKGATDHSASLGSEHQYDATHTMPREMINKLDELGFIHRELHENQLGNLLLLEGKLSVVDVSVIKDFMKPASDILLSSLPSATKQEKEQKAILEKTFKPAFEFIKEIPYAFEGKLLVDTGEYGENDIPYCSEVWMTLNRKEMINDGVDINFKHGEFMSGKWYVLGVLDATPYDNFTYHTQKNEMKEMISQTMGMLREQFGRPNLAFGMTPIAIFRVLRPKS